MSPWELIGWVIALPLVVFSLVITFALLYAAVKHVATSGKTEERKKRHLRIVEDNEPA